MISNKQKLEDTKLTFLVYYAVNYETNEEILQEFYNVANIQELKNFPLFKKMEKYIYKYVTKDHKALMCMLSHFLSLEINIESIQDLDRAAIINDYYDYRDVNKSKLFKYEKYLKKSLRFEKLN